MARDLAMGPCRRWYIVPRVVVTSRVECLIFQCENVELDVVSNVEKLAHFGGPLTIGSQSWGKLYDPVLFDRNTLWVYRV